VAAVFNDNALSGFVKLTKQYMKHLKVKVQDVVDGKEKSPLPLEVIPNFMGINLVAVDNVEWDELDDGQIVALTINFTPVMRADEKHTDFISRLFDEKNQLDEKIAKLEAFTKSDAFNGINNVQHGLLKIQLNVMTTYSQVLDERLWRLSPSGSVS